MKLIKSGNGRVTVEFSDAELVDMCRTACESAGYISEFDPLDVWLEVDHDGTGYFYAVDRDIRRAERQSPKEAAGVRAVMREPVHPIPPGEILIRHRGAVNG